MVERLRRWAARCDGKTKRSGMTQRGDGARLEVETPDGRYAIEADYVIAADGARSAVRDMLGLAWKGQVFRDRFLIADVSMRGDFPTERWFWFDPPFHPGGSALLHKQADDIWRIDLQLGWDCDPDEEKKPEHVIPRIRAMLGDGRAFELEWVSVYTFQCARLERFVHDHVIFVAMPRTKCRRSARAAATAAFRTPTICAGSSRESCATSRPRRSCESYNDETGRGSRRKDPELVAVHRLHHTEERREPKMRDAVLALSQQHPFARRLVNSGRLSTPTAHRTGARRHPMTILSPPRRARRSGGGCSGAGCQASRVAARSAGGRFDLLVFDANEEVADALDPNSAASLRVTRIASERSPSAQELQMPRALLRAGMRRSRRGLFAAPRSAHRGALAKTFSRRRALCIAARARNRMTFNSEANIQQPDDFYQALIDAHAGLTDEQSAALNARLVLLLANRLAI